MGVYLQASSGAAPTHVTLEPGADASSIAAACRSAGLEFMRGVRAGWDARDLSAWLTGAYAEATCYVPRGEATLTPVDTPCKLTERLREARAGVLAALEEARSASSRLSFVRDAIRTREIIPALDASGDSFWIPLDRRKMQLRERVLSLFAADYLLHPVEYAGDLIVCPTCEAIVFDAKARALGQCGAHRTSGFLDRAEILEKVPDSPGFFEDYESDSAIPLMRMR
jgi:hypothetical protein